MPIPFFCPKCGKYTTNSINRICPGVEFSCVVCDTIYSISYGIVYDGDDKQDVLETVLDALKTAS